jgi:hypothetical protein
MIEATNENELLNILRVISEEAVKLSKKSLNEVDDPYVGAYQTQYRKDEKLYGSLSEQEEEEEEEEDEPADLEPEDDLEDESDEDPLEDEDEPESEEATDFGVSFDSVLSAINNLRAGKSLKDSSIKDQASAYYDRLDDTERKVLLVFLQQFSEILSGAVQGSEADDPSDSPYNITMSVAGEEDADDEEVPEEVITDEEEDDAGFEELESKEEESPEEEEDTSPPIRVNEAQDLRQIRRKIRSMMLRG